MVLSGLPPFVAQHYEVHEWRHASAILATDYRREWSDILAVLTGFRVHKSEIEVGGGSKSRVAGRIDAALAKKGWREKSFATKIVVDAVEHDSPTHKVDCFKNRVGLEIEWNNKDPFFDRDLNNFRLLFDLHALSVGVIVTRCDELQEIFVSLGRGKSFGNSTTHMSKLLPRLNGGGGGGCPVLVFGIKARLYVED
ncbi:MAG: BglII/BstYI family type II restriction endonuclease [Gemmatimonadales bacterium]